MKTKDTNREKFSNRQRNVENLLKQCKHSVTDITIILGYSDPRSYIRTLRDKGVNVLDEWVQKEDIRYKLYWINVAAKPQPNIIN